jgi:hypothetical protein
MIGAIHNSAEAGWWISLLVVLAIVAAAGIAFWRDRLVAGAALAVLAIIAAAILLL